ncbi:MAG: hypothetical protein A2Y62_18315, partial [Candidatus Fischerbacteria bacterium RBG_13_37_8]
MAGVLLLCGGTACFIASQENPSHSGLAGEQYNCNICHAGHGVSATPMLNQKFIDLCYYCHSSDNHPPALKTKKPMDRSHFNRGVSVRNSLTIANAPLPDIRFAFSKRFRHPIETESFHQFNEFLLEIPNLPRHSSCLDCHNPHLASKEKSYAGVVGFDLNGYIVMDSPKESFVCYKCHSEYGNKPLQQKDILSLFQIINPSFHPVENQGKNSFVPSLLFPYDTTSIITCSDCHNNDEASPRGPHGSIYPFILEKNYTPANGIFENERTYAMCYKCHSRISILNNESFPEHHRHIVGNKISCISCHDAHGS